MLNVQHIEYMLNVFFAEEIVSCTLRKNCVIILFSLIFKSECRI